MVQNPFPGLDQEQVRQLAAAGGLSLDGADLDEVTHRYNALMGELSKLPAEVLEGFEPWPVFPWDEDASNER